MKVCMPEQSVLKTSPSHERYGIADPRTLSRLIPIWRGEVPDFRRANFRPLHGRPHVGEADVLFGGWHCSWRRLASTASAHIRGAAKFGNRNPHGAWRGARNALRHDYARRGSPGLVWDSRSASRSRFCACDLWSRNFTRSKGIDPPVLLLSVLDWRWPPVPRD